MNKPPMKAIEQIKKYCEKTQCRTCVFGMPEDNNRYVGCELTELPPCEWDTGEDGDGDVD